MWKSVLCCWAFHVRLQSLWYHWCRGHCLCMSWLFCSQQHCWPLQRRRPEEYWLGFSTSSQMDQSGSRTECDANLWYCVSVLCSPTGSHWTPVPGRINPGLCDRHVSCPWPQGRVLFPLCHIVHTRHWSDNRWNLGDAVVISQFNHPYCSHCNVGKPCRDNWWPCDRL